MSHFSATKLILSTVFDLLAHADDSKEDANPFSFKNFLSDDMASRNKRILKVFTKVILVGELQVIAKNSSPPSTVGRLSAAR